MVSDNWKFKQNSQITHADSQLNKNNYYSVAMVIKLYPSHTLAGEKVCEPVTINL